MTTATEPTKRDNDRETMLGAIANLASDPQNVLEWILLRKRFKYSFANSALILNQYPDLQHDGTVACRTDWVKYGREVNADATPIFIWSKPFLGESRTQTDQNGKPKKIRIFKMQPVWAEDDTTVVNEAKWEAKKDVLYRKAQRTKLSQERQPLDGDSHAAAIPALVKLAEDNGLTVEFKALRGKAYESAGGYYEAATSKLVVNTGKGNPFGTSPNAQVRILVHELVHAIGDTSYEKYGQAQAEILTDLTTWMVLATVGIEQAEADCKVYAAGWLAGCRNGITDTVKAVKTQAKLLDVTAYTIEQAIIGVLDPEALRKVADES